MLPDVNSGFQEGLAISGKKGSTCCDIFSTPMRVDGMIAVLETRLGPFRDVIPISLPLSAEFGFIR
jgi:hypothetical protein